MCKLQGWVEESLHSEHGYLWQTSGVGGRGLPSTMLLDTPEYTVRHLFSKQ